VIDWFKSIYLNMIIETVEAEMTA
jgi:hypothetical protein